MHTRIIRAAIFRSRRGNTGVRPRTGGPARYKPQPRPLASIGGSNAPQLFVSTWCDIETRPCSNSRLLMSEFGRDDFVNQSMIPKELHHSCRLRYGFGGRASQWPRVALAETGYGAGGGFSR